MIEKEDIVADLHIHTIGLIYGFSTLNDCIEVPYGVSIK